MASSPPELGFCTSMGPVGSSPVMLTTIRIYTLHLFSFHPLSFTVCNSLTKSPDHLQCCLSVPKMQTNQSKYKRGASIDASPLGRQGHQQSSRLRQCYPEKGF